MAGFTPEAGYTTGPAVAGISDARQKPDRVWGCLITRSRLKFLSLIGDMVLDEKKLPRSVKPVIGSRDTFTMNPEVFDSEVMPYSFRLTADVSGINTGDSEDLILDDASGIEVDDTLTYFDINNKNLLRVTGISGNTVTVKVIDVQTEGSTFTGSATDRQVAKLNNASTDYQTIGQGIDKELIQRTNPLQLSYKAISQGYLQKHLALQANPGGDGINADFMRRKEEVMIDMMKQRNQQMILSGSNGTEGSGASRRTYYKGLLGWASRVVTNANPGGELPYDDFINVHMAGAFAHGGGGELWAVGGLQVNTALSSFYQKQIRITNNSNEYNVNVTRYETSMGFLNFVRDDTMDSDATRGMMFTFDPQKLERNYLRGLDFKYLEGLELNNVLGERAAWVVAENIMAYGDNVTLHTNILKGAA